MSTRELASHELFFYRNALVSRLTNSYRGFIHRPRTGQANDTSSGVHRDSWSPPTAAGQQSPTTTANLTRTSPRQSPRQSKI
eukprot:contig_27031_g6648